MITYSLTTIDARSLYELRSQYKVLPSCQREFVWKKSKQQSFIDSLLRGLPIPPLAYIETFIELFGTKKELVDGQQRFITICRYYNGDFATGLGFGATERKPIYPGLLYIELPQEVRTRLDCYKIPLLSISEEEPDIIGLVFRRWQGGQPLTFAEKLFSFDGTTKEIAVNITEHPFWSRLYGGDKIRRQPFQAGLKLIILESLGAFSNLTAPRQVDILVKQSIDWSKMPERIHRRMDFVTELFDGASITSIGQLVLIYQAIMLLEEAGYNLKKCQSGCLSHWFMEVRESAHSDQRNGNIDLFLQIDKVAAQRDFWKLNFDVISEIAIDGKLADKRLADMHDKIRLWNLQKGKCPVCKKDLRFRDGNLVAHHIIPYSMNGKTEVDNMMLVHSECHQEAEIRVPKKEEIEAMSPMML